MVKVKFISNIDRDIENIFNKCNKKPKYGNFKIDPAFEKICRGKSLEESERGLKIILNKIYNPNIQKYLKKVHKDFGIPLKKISL